MRLFWATLFFFVLGFAVSCDSSPQPAPSEEAAVKWPQLRALDDLAHRADAAIEAGDPDKALALAEEVKMAADTLVTDGVPEGVKNREAVSAMVQDVKILAADLEGYENRPAEEIGPVLASFHPLVLSIMETAGLPHVHGDRDHDHDHDHGDHDDEHEGDHGEHDHEH